MRQNQPAAWRERKAHQYHLGGGSNNQSEKRSSAKSGVNIESRSAAWRRHGWRKENNVENLGVAKADGGIGMAGWRWLKLAKNNHGEWRQA
jgi:hypothetical protein